MATLAELESALRKADAAGNAEDAKAFADAIRQMRQSAPDFSNVQSTVRTPEKSLAERYAAAGIDPNEHGPAEGMSGLELNLAGIGESLDTGWRGLKQVGASMADYAVRANTRPDQATGVKSRLRATQERLRDEEAEARRVNAPLNATPAGMTGNIVGTVAQFLGPGLGLRSTAAGAALLPRTVAGNAALGGVVGGIQPTASEGERAGNIAVGGILGAAGQAIPQVIGAGIRTAGNLIPAVSQRMQTRAAGNVLNQFAADPIAVRAGASSPQVLVPGSMPTLAEATGDVGLAGLQRTLANTPDFGNALAQRQSANNLALVRAIEASFGGADEAASAGVRAARDQAARVALKPIDRLPISSLDKVVAGVQRLSEKHQAAPNVRAAMDAVKAELPNVRTVGDAHDLRQYIGQLMGGQVEGKAGAKLAKRELLTVQGLLDREMRAAFPEWGAFLRDHKALSREADRIDVGAEFLATGRAVRTGTNDPALTPAAFGRAAGNLDRTVQRATGFRHATAERTLTPEQVRVVDAVRRDLERYSRASTEGKAIGSNTMQNIVGGNTFQSAVGPVGAAVVEPISGIALMGLNQMRKTYGAKVAGLVEEAMLDPARAAEILASVPAGQRAEVVRAAASLIPRIGGTAGAVSPALAE